MEVSRVSISAETRAKLDNPGLGRQKKAQLRQEAVKAYIRSKPAGTPITVAELLKAGQWKSHGSGWATIQRMKKSNEITQEPIEHSHRSYWTVVGDVKTIVPAKPKTSVDSGTESGGGLSGPVQVKTADPNLSSSLPNSVDVTCLCGKCDLNEIRIQAKQFAWDHNSDSLRDFIATLQ